MLLDHVHDFGVFHQAFAQGLENVVHHDGGGLALDHGFAGGVHLVFGQVVGVAGGVDGNVVGGLVVPLFQVRVLILEGVGEFVGQHRLLLFNVYPVEQVDGLGFRVVVGLDLFFQERE